MSWCWIFFEPIGSSRTLRLRFIGACFMVHPRVAQAVSELWAVLKDLLWMVMNQLAAEPCSINKWVFPKIGVPQNGWFIMENPIKMDDLGAHLFLVQHPNQGLTWFDMSFFGVTLQDAKRDGKLPEAVMPRILQRLAEPLLGTVEWCTGHRWVMQLVRFTRFAKEYPLLYPLQPLWLPWRSSWFGTDAQCTTRYLGWYATCQRKTWQDMGPTKAVSVPSFWFAKRYCVAASTPEAQLVMSTLWLGMIRMEDSESWKSLGLPAPPVAFDRLIHEAQAFGASWSFRRCCGLGGGMVCFSRPVFQMFLDKEVRHEWVIC